MTSSRKKQSARTARKKAVKPVKMWARYDDDGEIMVITHNRRDALNACQNIALWGHTTFAPVLVTPIHKGKP